MLIPINLNDFKESKPVPNGRYDLTIASAELGKTKEKGNPQFIVSIGIDGHEDAPNVTHYIGLPADGDEPRTASFKALMLKRFLTLFGIPIDPAGIDTDLLITQMPGCTAGAELGLSDPDQSKDQSIYNRLVVPKLRDEGAGVAGRSAPKPPSQKR